MHMKLPLIAHLHISYAYNHMLTLTHLHIRVTLMRETRQAIRYSDTGPWGVKYEEAVF